MPVFDDEIACVEGERAVGLRAYLVDRRRRDHTIAEGVISNLAAILEILG